MSEFKLKKGVTLPDLPPFPLNECLNGSVPIEAQRKLGIIYQALAVDFIQGKGDKNEHTPMLSGRSYSHSERGPAHTEDLTGRVKYTPQNRPNKGLSNRETLEN